MALDLDAVINSAVDNAMDEGTLPDDGVNDEGADSGDTSTDTTTDNETTETAETADADAATTTDTTKTADVVVVDALLEELKTSGFKPRNPKDNKIPYENVQKITANREKRATEAVAKALGVDPTSVTFDKLESVIADKIGSFANLEEEATNFHRAEEIMMNDPDRYIRILATIEPQKYGKYLKVLEGGATEKPKEEEFNIELPEFDLDLGNGVKTYSPEGIQKAFAAIAKQAIAEGKRQATETTEAALRPLKDRESAAEEKLYLEHRHKEITAWRGMDKHYDTWLKALQADTKQATVGGKLSKARLKYKTPEQAYIDVVVPLLQDAENEKAQTVREKLIEDSNKKASSTGVGVGTSVKKKKESSGDPIIDAIERSLAAKGL